MSWEVVFCDEFASEYEALNEAVQDELLAQLMVLEQFGPQLGRPHADTLKGSTHTNMKELRIEANGGIWRIAFDPRRQAVVLVAGEKSGFSQRLFYRRLIRTADQRFARHLGALKEGE